MLGTRTNLDSGLLLNSHGIGTFLRRKFRISVQQHHQYSSVPSSLNYNPRLESVHFYLDGFRENYGPWKKPKNWVNCPGAAWAASPECGQSDFLG